MLNGFWGIASSHVETSAAEVWHWLGANALSLLVAIFFLQGLCTLWLALHARTLSRQLHRAARNSEQYAALTQGVGRSASDLRIRLDVLEFAIKTLENNGGVTDHTVADPVRSEVALQTGAGKSGSIDKRKAKRSSARSNRVFSEVGSTSAD